MGQGTLTIYNASAGSGKTYKLTAIYLINLFKSGYNYRKILAVTFTNKATAEMKSRILDNLYFLASGSSSDYLQILIDATNMTEEEIRRESAEILNSILHDFSRFSITTIDSFFQRVLRSFAREAGLHSGFNIEIDHSTILSDAIDDMISSVSEDIHLKKWLITFALSNIDEEKSWNIKDRITKLSEELFSEKFKILSVKERTKLEDKNFLLEYIKNLRSLISSFENKLKDFGKRADEVFTLHDLSDEMFYRKGQGIPGFIKSLLSGNLKEPNGYVREICKSPPRWSTSQVTAQLQSAIDEGLEDILCRAIKYYDENIVNYKTAGVILSNIYALGILSDVSSKIHQITTSENSFLLSDAGELLSLITMEDQSPFIYEKIGNRFENFMIDEFQDTSIIQWNNFKPLIENSMAEGHDNLVVGDVKQSIYRWRNSDWQILGKILINSVDNKRILSESLTTNWRSRSEIISFNNCLFGVIPELIDNSLQCESVPLNFARLYSEAMQKDPCRKKGGYVRMEFVSDDEEKKWEQIVLERIPHIIETVQDKGYKASDIGIIVRDGRQGCQVLNKLIGYNQQTSGGIYNFNAVSDDSLLLSNSPVIIFIIAVISVVNDPQDYINRAVMLRYFLIATGNQEEAESVPLRSDYLIEESRKWFPVDYEDMIGRLDQIPLFEAIEKIIGFFRLGDFSSNVPFLNIFQDYVVTFTGSKNSDIQSFLEWWDETGKKKSLVLPGNQDAIRILTIHKSKGLEFKIVILPFLSWNLDHMSSKQPILWVKPEVSPFSDLGIVPVRYSRELASTIFSDYYEEEKYSVYLDNINLLYVALTRAKDALIGFSHHEPKKEASISAVLKKAFTTPGFYLNTHYNNENNVFETGEIPVNSDVTISKKGISESSYSVSKTLESLKLKLHGENYFSSETQEIRKKINYGKLMHEIFEGIDTEADIPAAIRNLVLEGKIAKEESEDIKGRVMEMIRLPVIADWFMPGNKVMKEAGILLPAGVTRRPDRVIFRDGKTTIIDFKFGEENANYSGQVNQYRNLLLDMGYKDIDAFIWYVDKNKIVTA